ncbi:MAG TPA: ATP-binding protein [Vicinamibacterales bacterium]|nr:ATP-binding protein [Vicinamibacterales bacterium]
MAPPPRPPRLSHDRRILLMSLASALPGALIALIFLWSGEYTPKVQWTLTVLIVTFCLGFSLALRERVILPLQTLSNLLAALGEGDFSIRARGARGGDPLGEVMVEVNALVETLRHQRLDALEATTLLRKVMAEIDVAVFTFDEASTLKFVNRAGARLLAHPAERLLGRRAADIALDPCLTGDAPRVIDTAFAGAVGRWEVRRSRFRQGGRPHELLVLSDLSRPLREEERQAFQRLIRVIGHEMNNSLAPIKSIAGSLAAIIDRDPAPDDWRDDVQRGLGVIASRSESLSRFMSAYARLAKLPPPKLTELDVGRFVDRVVILEKAHEIRVQQGPPLLIQADGDQLEQLLINLISNAVDAVRETGGGVTIGWDRWPGPAPSVELWVEDEGHGLSNTGNLFVPFFTTKPGGSGIGRPQSTDRRGAWRKPVVGEPRGPPRVPRESPDAGAGARVGGPQPGITKGARPLLTRRLGMRRRLSVIESVIAARASGGRFERPEHVGHRRGAVTFETLVGGAAPILRLARELAPAVGIVRDVRRRARG